jgi:Fur family ferric uptake transcriptional regulator
MRVGACRQPEAAHHHHIVCERCGRVEETDGCPVQDMWDTLRNQVLGSSKFELTGHITQYMGVCPACRPAGARD